MRRGYSLGDDRARRAWHAELVCVAAPDPARHYCACVYMVCGVGAAALVAPARLHMSIAGPRRRTSSKSASPWLRVALL